ncbi:MAG: hypothetical protein COB12_07480 [Flavobacterium sp.]|nr:MAG: hypothetical protein COB12_07480 [Flavobacterium sp.]
MFEDEENDGYKSHDEIKKIPVFKKAWDLSILVRHLIKSVENTEIDFKNEYEEDMLNRNLQYLAENSMIIPAKISGAEAADSYDLKMENAAIIRKAARELITDARGLQMCGYKETEYLDLLRSEVEEFRVLFAEWVKTFDPWNYIIDRWGLFNPPGVNYDDKDPDDDIPFNPLDELGDL